MGKVITDVFMVCNAYESGVGQGMKRSGYKNPYQPGSDEHEAWKIGYDFGVERSEPDKSANTEAKPRREAASA